MLPKKTKIIATLGPSSENPNIIEKLIKEGVDIFRFNLKYNTFEWHYQNIIKVRKISKELGFNVSVMVDVPDPKKDEITNLGARTEDASALRKYEADFIALSYVNTARQVLGFKSFLKKARVTSFLISKIESRAGVKNITNIIEKSDGIMIARGDLGDEVDYEKVTVIQKNIIKKCRDMAKPVIVATEMLESMVKSQKPTRAEAADVSNAVFDGTDCVMLSAETSLGSYPVQSVQAMNKIISYNEKPAIFLNDFNIKTQPQVIVHSGFNIIDNRQVDKVIVFTKSGYTARLISRYRANIPIIAISSDKSVINQLNLSYGVTGYAYTEDPDKNFKYPERLFNLLIKEGLVAKKEKILVIHGTKWWDSGNTNALVVLQI